MSVAYRVIEGRHGKHRLKKNKYSGKHSLCYEIGIAGKCPQNYDECPVDDKNMNADCRK